MTPDRRKLGRSIRAARRLLNLSQAALAERAGVHELSVRNVEYGRHAAKESTLAKLLSALGAAIPLPYEHPGDEQ